MWLRARFDLACSADGEVVPYMPARTGDAPARRMRIVGCRTLWRLGRGELASDLLGPALREKARQPWCWPAGGLEQLCLHDPCQVSPSSEVRQLSGRLGEAPLDLAGDPIEQELSDELAPDGDPRLLGQRGCGAGDSAGASETNSP